MTTSITINRPAFDTFDVSTVESTLDDLLKQCRDVVASVAESTDPTWQSVMMPLDDVHNRLSLFYSPVSHLNAVKNSPELREVHKACLPKFSAYYTEVGQNKELYAVTKSLRAITSNH